MIRRKVRPQIDDDRSGGGVNDRLFVGHLGERQWGRERRGYRLLRRCGRRLWCGATLRRCRDGIDGRENQRSETDGECDEASLIIGSRGLSLDAHVWHANDVHRKIKQEQGSVGGIHALKSPCLPSLVCSWRDAACTCLRAGVDACVHKCDFIPP